MCAKTLIGVAEEARFKVRNSDSQRAGCALAARSAATARAKFCDFDRGSIAAGFCAAATCVGAALRDCLRGGACAAASRFCVAGATVTAWLTGGLSATAPFRTGFLASTRSGPLDWVSAHDGRSCVAHLAGSLGGENTTENATQEAADNTGDAVRGRRIWEPKYPSEQTNADHPPALQCVFSEFRSKNGAKRGACICRSVTMWRFKGPDGVGKTSKKADARRRCQRLAGHRNSKQTFLLPVSSARLFVARGDFSHICASHICEMNLVLR